PPAQRDARGHGDPLTALEVSDEGGEAYGLDLEGHLARLELAEVEQTVDELEEALRRLADTDHHLITLRARPPAVPVEQHLRVAHHDVKRRAQLVGHAGDELGLEAARGETLLVEELQLLGALGDLCLELPGPREAAIGAHPLAPELAEDMPVEEGARVEEEEAGQGGVIGHESPESKNCTRDVQRADSRP